MRIDLREGIRKQEAVVGIYVWFSMITSITHRLYRLLCSLTVRRGDTGPKDLLSYRPCRFL